MTRFKAERAVDKVIKKRRQADPAFRISVKDRLKAIELVMESDEQANR